VPKFTPQLARELSELALQGRLDVIKVVQDSKKKTPCFTVKYHTRNALVSSENYGSRRDGYRALRTIGDLLEQNKLLKLLFLKDRGVETYHFTMSTIKEADNALENNPVCQS